ncbi:c-di-GMP phosphodiesterase [Methylomarinovum caldicuralii]|uniref:C-di-GMP phosphodiesterase n=1 Tax=Methylomarinovum caldicuralii TaxID=438856 RepID=A0AAU9BXQ2_9GAMM|nr:HDOD domain-containing protein [Methylomarinovum caldicuralii]BCX80792.1 c-di-GMP phosphodiesterase [Methylomarinovum caldicuralii]
MSRPLLIGRQPIFDRQQRLFGYELLFRDPDPGLSPETDGDRASERLLVDAVLEYGLDALCGDGYAFVNVTRDNVLSNAVRALPKERVVLEILEDVTVDAELVAAVRDLAAAGYTIALDDFVFEPAWEPLVRLARIVKVDLLAHTAGELETLVRRLRPYGVRLLAEKVETEAVLQRCHQLGFHYFQGYHLQKPQLVRGKRIDAGRLAQLRLLAAINDPKVTVENLAAIVRTDPGLSFKLLKFINSARFALPGRVDSIERAIVLLGLAELKRWATLLMLSEAITESPGHTLRLSLCRARMCERLAETANMADTASFFLVGLLSILESVLQKPMADILPHLPLAKPVAEGLLGRGPGGEALGCVLAYENWKMDAVRFRDLPLPVLGELYLESLRWAAAAVAEMH